LYYSGIVMNNGIMYNITNSTINSIVIFNASFVEVSIIFTFWIII